MGCGVGGGLGSAIGGLGGAVGGGAACAESGPGAVACAAEGGAAGYAAGGAAGCAAGGIIGSWLEDAISSGVTPRPDGLTRLEERAFDRYCDGSQDPCAELKKAIRQAIVMARLKMSNMLRDKLAVHGTTRWTTHASDLNGRIQNIAAMISLGQKMGCDMTVEVVLAAGLFVPGAPQ